MANTKYDLRGIETALKLELARMRDQDLARWPGDESMQAMFKQDYLDGLNIACLIGIGKFDMADERLCWMDTSAREAVAECIVRVNKDFFVDHIMGDTWKHPDEWYTRKG